MSSSIHNANSANSSCSSTPSQPIQIGFASTRRGSEDASYYASDASASSTRDCAYPSHTTTTSSHYGSSSIQRRPKPTSYFSDEELFGDDQTLPILRKAPGPPRTAEQWLSQDMMTLVESETPPFHLMQRERSGSKPLAIVK
ncbi:hypothetical protein MBLNU459_g6584t1 [Dothideomycetes sp. NU459]